MSRDTIFALSSGSPPSGIAVVRISGPGAIEALESLCTQRLPPARNARVRTLRTQDGVVLDKAIVLLFPAPDSATGEDVVELHLHGGRATIEATCAEIAMRPNIRLADPGEFTRRAFSNGRLDLSQAEGLSALLSAETEMQRRAAWTSFDGGLRALTEEFRAAVVQASARVEAAIEYGDEDDVIEWGERTVVLRALADKITEVLARPPAERLRDGLKVVIAGPPNAGKSTLLNVLTDRSAAIVSPIAGTTRDAIEVPVQFAGIPLVFVDTAGLRENPQDPVEILGIERSHAWVEHADIILWLGDESRCLQPNALLVAAKSDLTANESRRGLAVSARNGTGIADLKAEIVALARSLGPAEGSVLLNVRQRECLAAAATDVANAASEDDLLVAAALLGYARTQFDRITGRADVEEMLDALFGTFCIGK